MNNYTKINLSTVVINIVDNSIYNAVERWGKDGKKYCYFA